MQTLRVLALALLALTAALPAAAQQQYDTGGKARVSIYCKNAVAGDVACKSDAGGNTTVTIGLNPQTPLTEAKIDFASSGDQAIVAAVTSKTTKVYALFMVCSAATTITFKDGSTTLTGAMTLTAGGSITLDLSGIAWFTGTANTAFNINSANAVQCSGRFYYVNS